MKKLLFLLLCLIATTVSAQKNAAKNYLKGSVVVKDGLVTFDKTFDAPGMNKAQLFTKMLAFANQLVKDSQHDKYSKITMQSEQNQRIVANVRETIYFKKRKWSTDASEMSYRILMEYSDGKAYAKIQDIVYDYEDAQGLKAEKWITDEYALKNDGKEFKKDSGKFRKYTIDRANAILTSLANTIKQ